MESMGRSRARGAVPVLSVDGQLSIAPVCTARSNDFGRTSVGRSACGSTKRRGAAPRSLLASRAPGGSRAREASRSSRGQHPTGSGVCKIRMLCAESKAVTDPDATSDFVRLDALSEK